MSAPPNFPLGTGFLDLPLEIRTMVYELIVPRKISLHMSVCRVGVFGFSCIAIRNEMRPYLYLVIKVYKASLDGILAQATHFNVRLQHLGVITLSSNPFGVQIAYHFAYLRTLHVEIPTIDKSRNIQSYLDISFARRGLMTEIREIMASSRHLTNLTVDLGSEGRIRVVYTTEVGEDACNDTRAWQFTISGSRGNRLPFSLADI